MEQLIQKWPIDRNGFVFVAFDNDMFCWIHVVLKLTEELLGLLKVFELVVVYVAFDVVFFYFQKITKVLYRGFRVRILFCQCTANSGYGKFVAPSK